RVAEERHVARPGHLDDEPIEHPAAAEGPGLEPRAGQAHFRHAVARPFGRLLVDRRAGEARAEPIGKRRKVRLDLRVIQAFIADPREHVRLREQTGGPRRHERGGADDRVSPPHFAPSRMRRIFASRSVANRPRSRRYSSSIFSTSAGSTVFRRASRCRICRSATRASYTDRASAIAAFFSALSLCPPTPLAASGFGLLLLEPLHRELVSGFWRVTHTVSVPNEDPGAGERCRCPSAGRRPSAPQSRSRGRRPTTRAG